ncbi:hypothetical protein [Luteimonas deserti]|uniref:Uncharacterized protein n=1 Tax=Luteimonas deserti TaxID=2752306 RepID=A0A7Z0QSH1_9GAMM|nr:hypothetical protein [Luteimonas deserti]NYZ62643.1 hypothetical protein [Luteimonas deserti]
MAWRRWSWMGLLILAGVALWMLVAGRTTRVGIDIGMLGSVWLLGTAWLALYTASTMPRGELEQGIAPGEWQAWIGTVFMCVATLYFVSKLHVFGSESIPHAPQSRVVVRNLVVLLIAWTVLSRVLVARWNGHVQSDERDRDIEARAAGWGRAALVSAMVALAVTLGLSPVERLDWATHFMIANLLILLLMCGWLVEYAATAVLYWHDRRDAA